MEAIDISPTLLAKSDQLNGDDLIGGPITVQIVGVNMAEGEQPVIVKIAGFRPWKPCKTMRRLLVHAWGADASKWIGRWLKLYRDATVRFGGEDVGGIRIAAISDIPSRITISLAVTKGKKGKVMVDVLRPPVTHMSEEDLRRACNGAMDRGWTREGIAALLGGKVADVPADKRREFAAILAAPPKPSAPKVDDEPGFDDDDEGTEPDEDGGEEE